MKNYWNAVFAVQNFGNLYLLKFKFYKLRAIGEKFKNTFLIMINSVKHRVTNSSYLVPVVQCTPPFTCAPSGNQR